MHSIPPYIPPRPFSPIDPLLENPQPVISATQAIQAANTPPTILRPKVRQTGFNIRQAGFDRACSAPSATILQLAKLILSPSQRQLEIDRRQGPANSSASEEERADWPQSWESCGTKHLLSYPDPASKDHDEKEAEEPSTLNSLQARAIHKCQESEKRQGQLRKQKYRAQHEKNMQQFGRRCQRGKIQPDQALRLFRRRVNELILKDPKILRLENLHWIHTALSDVIALLGPDESNLPGVFDEAVFFLNGKIDHSLLDAWKRQLLAKHRITHLETRWKAQLPDLYEGILDEAEELSDSDLSEDQLDPILPMNDDELAASRALDLLEEHYSQIGKGVMGQNQSSSTAQGLSTEQISEFLADFRMCIEEFRTAMHEINALYVPEITAVIYNTVKYTHFVLTQGPCKTISGEIEALYQGELSNAMATNLRNEMQERNTPQPFYFLHELIISHVRDPETLVQQFDPEVAVIQNLHKKPNAKELMAYRTLLPYAPRQQLAEEANVKNDANDPQIFSLRHFINKLEASLTQYESKFRSNYGQNLSEYSFIIYNTVKFVFFLLSKDTAEQVCKRIRNTILNLCREKLSSAQLSRLENEMKARHLPPNFPSLQKIIIDHINDPEILMKQIIKQMKINELHIRDQPQLNQEEIISHLKQGFEAYKNTKRQLGGLYSDLFYSTIYDAMKFATGFLLIDQDPGHGEQTFNDILAVCPEAFTAEDIVQLKKKARKLYREEGPQLTPSKRRHPSF